MKLYTRVLFVVAMMSALMLSTSSFAVVRASKEGEQPPQLEKGWNIVSVPCDISLADFRQKHGLEGIDAYSWNGTGYDKAESLKRGVGYIINSNSVINPSSVCDLNNSSSGFVMTLKQGWNLIGNPYRQSVAASELFGQSKDKISSMYEYKGNKYVSMSMDDKLKPWRGFWVYADEDISAPSPMTCSLRVNAYKSQDAGEKPISEDAIKIEKGVALYLAAIETCKAPGGSAEENDVTSKATWGVSNSGVGSVSKEGVFVALGAGEISVSATFNNMAASKTIIVNGDMMVGLYISARSLHALYPGDKISVKAYANYFKKECGYEQFDKAAHPGCFYDKDVTASAEWINTNPEAGTLVKDVFTAKAAGTTRLSAKFVDMKSQEIKIEVIDKLMMFITVKGYRVLASLCDGKLCYYAKVGKDAPFRAYGKSVNLSLATEFDMTDSAKWEISDESIATIDARGNLTPKKGGMVWIRATVGDARSGKTYVMVFDNEKTEFLTVGIYNDYTFIGKAIRPIKVGTSYIIRAEKISYDPALLDCRETCWWAYSTSNLVCTSVIVSCGQGLSYEDVTDRADWKISNEDIAEVGMVSSNSLDSYSPWHCSDTPDKKCSKQIGIMGKSPGVADVSAELDGLVSNKVSIDVWDHRDMKFCDDDNVNSGEWKDEHTRAVLETDCDAYKKGSPVNIRYTAQVASEMMLYLDSCVDLFVMNEKDEIVKTLRNEGCTNESVKGRSSARVNEDVFQTVETWDMTNDAGNVVPAGKYYAVARFYIVWDPVIILPFEVMD